MRQGETEMGGKKTPFFLFSFASAELGARTTTILSTIETGRDTSIMLLCGVYALKTLKGIQSVLLDFYQLELNRNGWQQEERGQKVIARDKPWRVCQLNEQFQLLFANFLRARAKVCEYIDP